MLMKMHLQIHQFGQNIKGATAIEYALIGGGVSVLIVVGVALIGGSMGNIFNSVVAAF